MENMKTKKRKSILFSLLGFVFSLGMSILILTNLVNAISFCMNAVKVPATITKVGGYYSGPSTDSFHYIMTVSYSYEDESYSTKSENMPIAWKEGKEIKIYVNPDNPKWAQHYGVSYWIFLPLALVVMSFFVYINLYGVISEIKKLK